jgi:predicted transposase YbfD/YdcC
MVSAWAEANEMVLSQFKVDEKSNEITAIPKLPKILDVSGRADYLLSVKEYQGIFMVISPGYFNMTSKTSSNSPCKAEHLSQMARRPWSIKNELYWILDIVLMA